MTSAESLLGESRGRSKSDGSKQPGRYERSNTWDDSDFAQWRRHVAEVLLHDEEAVPMTIGVAALAKTPHTVESLRARLESNRREQDELRQEEAQLLSLLAAATTTTPVPDTKEGRATLRSTTFNLVNTCLGSGMLSLPWVLARCGVVGGLLLMLLVPLLADITIDFLVAAASYTGAHTLTTIAELTIGRSGGLLSAMTLLFLSFGVLVSYCVVIKQLAPRLARYGLALDETPSEASCLLLVCATCLVPLSSMPTMAKLGCASAASIVLIAGFVLAVVVAALRVELGDSPIAAAARTTDGAVWWVYFDGSVNDWLSALPIVAFSYLCHQNIPFMYMELGETQPEPSPSKRNRFRAAARLSLVAATVIYVATAAGGFVAFGSHTYPNLLVNLQPGPDKPLPDGLVPTLHAAFVG